MISIGRCNDDGLSTSFALYPLLCLLILQHRKHLLLREVLGAVLGVDGSSSLVPASRADFSVLIGELESLDHSNGLLNRSTDGKVVNVRSTEGTLGIDEEGTAKSDTLLLEKNAVSLGDGVVSVGELLR
jgi:hypothetical protein